MRLELNLLGWVSLEEEGPEFISLSAKGGHREKAAVCKPGRGRSPGPSHAGSLISDRQAPGL